jgi:hypothetical protein
MNEIPKYMGVPVIASDVVRPGRAFLISDTGEVVAICSHPAPPGKPGLCEVAGGAGGSTPVRAAMIAEFARRHGFTRAGGPDSPFIEIPQREEADQ